MQNWKPMPETYFVKPDDIQVSNLIPEQFKKNHIEMMTGLVIAVGAGRLLESGNRAEPQASVGDKVMFGSKAGAEVTINGEKVLLLADVNIIAVDKPAVKTTFTLVDEAA